MRRHGSGGKQTKFMMEQETLQPRNSQEEEIDLLELAGRLWQRRMLIIKAAIIGAVAGLVIAFSIPKTYDVTVMLAPESRKSSSSLSAAASMLGLGDLSSLQGNDYDALHVLLFPDILDSDPFALELYSMNVTTKKDETMLLNEYIETQRKPWWSWIMSLPGKAIGGILSLIIDEEDEDGDHEIDPFRLSKKETKKLKIIKSSMVADVDKTTGVTTITVSMQDPLVAAIVADSVLTKLQDYITEYRTKKATANYNYLENIYNERQQEYYNAQQRYANYVDENKSLYTRRSMVEGERLQNDMSQAYQIYNQVAQQLQLANAKIQEAKPAFAVVHPSTVPIKAASPRKMLLLVGFTFLACVCSAGWVLFGEDIWEKMRKLLKAQSEVEKTE